MKPLINKYKLTKTDELVKLAREGDADAQYELGNRLYMGKSAKKSYELAREWYEAGAEQKHAECCLALGQMLVQGLGGDENQERAAEMFKIAADAGNRNAMFELGAMYAFGRGVKKNYVKATKYLRMSRTEEAIALLEESAGWWKPAAEQGIAEGEYQYGVCCINGYGMQSDFAEGYKWVYKAALRNHAKAIDAMSQIYENGLGVEPSSEKAEYWKKKYCEVTGTAPDKVGLSHTEDLIVKTEDEGIEKTDDGEGK